MPLLITQAEIEGLPSDARQRFVALEEVCRTRYEQLIAHEESWSAVQDARLQYMSTVVGAAKHLGIEPIASLVVPKKSQWDDGAYEDFKNELHFYIIQLALEGAEWNQQHTIELTGSVRARVQTLAAHLRDQLDKLDLPPAKLDKLRAKLAAFENELTAPKISFASIAAISLVVVSVVADVDGAGDAIRKLVTQLQVVLGQAKAEQDADAATKLPRQHPVKQLEPPRRPVAPKEAFDLDDEIPF